MGEASQGGGYREVAEGCAFFRDLPLSLLSVEGDDRLAWLHGQTTQDVASVAAGQVVEACICAPTGHLVTPLTIAAMENRAILVLPRDRSDTVAALAERTIFMEDVRVSELSEEWTIRIVAGPKSMDALRRLNGEATQLSESTGLAIPFNSVGPGWLLAGAPDHPFLRSLVSEIPEADPAMLATVQLERGLPSWDSDLNRRALPPEFGAAFLAGHVCYQKGCYTGQEVLMRIHSRGHTNRSWVVLRLQSEARTEAAIRSEGRAQAGIVTSCAVSPEFGPLAGALLQNDSATPGTRVWVQSDAGEIEAVVGSGLLRA